MPHVIIKLWPGKSEQQKQRLAEGVTKVVMTSFGYGEESVSVSLEEIAPSEWTRKSTSPTSSMAPASSTSRPATTRCDGQRCR